MKTEQTSGQGPSIASGSGHQSSQQPKLYSKALQGSPSGSNNTGSGNRGNVHKTDNRYKNAGHSISPRGGPGGGGYPPLRHNQVCVGMCVCVCENCVFFFEKRLFT